MMLLHGYWRSSAAWRCRIAFNLKGMQPEQVSVHLQRDGGQQLKPDYLALNPHGVLPSLEIDGEVLTQSLAIIEWLDETVPNPPLLPGNALERARIRAFALAIACEIHPLQNLRVQKFLSHELQVDKDGIDAWLHRWLGGGLQACESVLAGQPAGQAFAFGDAPTLADICLAPQLYSAKRFGIDIVHLPRLTALGAAYETHPAFVAAQPDRQPDAEA